MRPLPVYKPEYEASLNAALCAKCGGACCKRSPGLTHPDQWGAYRSTDDIEKGIVDREEEDGMFDRLVSAFAAPGGNWTIDAWPGGDPREGYVSRFDGPDVSELEAWEERPASSGETFLFVRPATADEKFLRENDRIGIMYLGFGGACGFHSDKGCALPTREMPAQCRSLVPAEDLPCVVCPEDKQTLSIAWIPYQRVLHRVVQHFELLERDVDGDFSGAP